MIAIIVPTYNRPEYFKKFFESLEIALRDVENEDIKIIISDDKSDNTELNTLLILAAKHALVTVRCLTLNIGVAQNMRSAIDAAEADAYICLDSDTIVTPGALTRLIDLHNRFPNDLVSGFDSRNTQHHACLEQHPDYAIKESIGGASMVFSAAAYKKYVRPALDAEAKNGEQRKWDFIACDNFKRAGRKIICTTPSVVEHIGFDSSLRHSTVAVAHNFNTNTLFISQPFGIGDIIFSAALVEKFRPHNVVWPVLPHFVEGCQKAYPQFNFVPWYEPAHERRDEHYTKDARYIPLRWAVENIHKPYSQVMRAKYAFYFEDWRQWTTVKPLRDYEREKKLMSILNVAYNEPFNLVSTKFGSDAALCRDVSTNNRLRTVEMLPINGFSLFDWIGIIETAAEIHAVSSSILYLAVMYAKGSVFVYRRTKLVDKDENNFSTVKYIFDEYNWTWEK